jgi:drug/metabolite transporter (DMT)-like permease
VEIVLLLAGCFGILALRRVDLIVLLLGCVLADILFTTFVHVPVRYMNFTNVALLIGLAVFLVALLRTLINTAAMTQRSQPPTLGS